MKKTKIIYWITTVLFAGMMIFSGTGTFTDPVQSKAFMTDWLGYPVYFTVFISIAKILGGLVLLLPLNYPRIKEWAYAGMFFDLVGAVYSFAAVGVEASSYFMMGLIILGGIISYITYHQLLKHKRSIQAQPALAI